MDNTTMTTKRRAEIALALDTHRRQLEALTKELAATDDELAQCLSRATDMVEAVSWEMVADEATSEAYDRLIGADLYAHKTGR